MQRVIAIGAITIGMLAGCKGSVLGPMPDLPIPVDLVDFVMTTPQEREHRRQEEDRRRREKQARDDRREAERKALTERANVILAALHEYDRDHGGAEPPHAAALVAGGYLVADDLILPNSRTDPAQVPVGDADLAGLAALPPAERLRAVQAAADALPDGVIAHRLGDYVFTCHGVEAAGRARPDLHDALWHVVGVADPDFNEPGAENVHDTATRRREATYWIYWTPNQNATRAEVGLPMLPALATVTHEAPAVAEPGWDKSLRVLRGLMDYLVDHPAPEPEPAHAAVLVAEGYIDAGDLILPGSRTDPSRIRVGNADLANLAGLPPAQRQRAVEAAARALPDDAVAHRLGDFVFTYHGTAPAFQSYQGLRDDLWFAVGSLDPEANGPPRPHDAVWLMFSLRRMYEPPPGWNPTKIEYGDLPERLRVQNRRRAFGRLPPLPDPAAVTH